MDMTYIWIGIVGFAALCALAAVLGLKKAVADLRELTDLRNRHLIEAIDRLGADVAAIERGLRLLGLGYQGKTTQPATWVKKEAAE